MLRQAGIEVEEGIAQEKCEELLIPFKHYLQGNFVFFKWAQRLDGTIDGGIISDEVSRRFVHGMRHAADLLVIGGNTVRIDRPTLDARLVGGRAPDVLIVSRSDEFDPSIPLFHVQNRRVFVASDLTQMKQYRNVMIEGGPGLFETTKALCDMYLCFVAPHSGGTIRFLNENNKFQIKHLRRSGTDVMQWMVNG